MRKGFSLTEILIVIALIGISLIVIFSNFYNRRNYSAIQLTTIQIHSIIQEARNKSIYKEKNERWGVYFSNSTSTNPFYSLFYSYYSTSTTVKKYNLTSSVEYDPSIIPLGGYMEVKFYQNGNPEISGTQQNLSQVDLILKSGDQIIATSSISINYNGLIDYKISTK